MRNFIYLIILFFLFSCEEINDQTILNNDYQIQTKEANTKLLGDELLIDNFTKKNRNSLKGGVNPWSGNPNDRNQYCKIKYNKDIKYGDNAVSLQITYSVDSSEKAFNGIYSELKNIDLSSFNNLVFYVKGDPDKKFTSIFKVEIKNNINQTGYYFVKGVSTDWQKITIPFKEINGISDFSSMKEFTIVFEDTVVTEKQGTIYIDDLYVTK